MPDAMCPVVTTSRRTTASEWCGYQGWRWWRTAAVRTLAVAGPALASGAIRGRLPWLPVLYLPAVVLAMALALQALRWRGAPGRYRWPSLAVVMTVLGALAPIPWLAADLDHPPGTAWRLDGRLTIDGEVVDPPGTWLWLTAGRPPIVAEVLLARLSGHGQPVNLRQGRVASRPRFSEPAAAAVGLNHGGAPIGVGALVRLSEPTVRHLPRQALLRSVNGIPITTRDAWDRARAGTGRDNTLVTSDGGQYRFRGRALPYQRIDIIDVPDRPLRAHVGGALARLGPGRWFRGLSVGRSHGLLVALVAYVDTSGHDVARGRTIAGTGAISADGTVLAISGLPAKAAAARDAGADVLLFPASQADDLAGFDPAGMELVPVRTLTGAIAALGGANRSAEAEPRA